MPDRDTIESAQRDEAEGKAPTTQAGEFVREEIEHVREGKHGARSAKQVIAIGLSKAWRAGVKLPPPRKGRTSAKARAQAARDYRKGQASSRRRPSPTRSCDLNAGDAPVRTVRLSELFTKPNRSLIIYHFMYGKRQTKPCPMCTAWLDGANGVAHHLAQNLGFAVVAAADLPTLRGHARVRGWDNLRLLSAGNSTFKYDFGSEDREGRQDSTVSVFTRDADGALRHFYTAHPWMAPDIRERGIDLLAPIWHFMDLTPQGRGNWYANLDYGTKVHAAST